MRTIIAGSRTTTQQQALVAIGLCPWKDRITHVLCGMAQGADRHGEAWAHGMGLTVDYYEAQWQTHGKAAGPIRNQQMADNAEALIAVWDGQSRGTADMIKRAKDKGLRIHIYNYITGEVTA